MDRILRSDDISSSQEDAISSSETDDGTSSDSSSDDEEQDDVTAAETSVTAAAERAGNAGIESLDEPQLEDVTLDYINNNYYHINENGFTPAAAAWKPEHRLSFEKTTQETVERYSERPTETLCDIDAFRGLIKLANLGKGLKLPIEIFARLDCGHPTVEKKIAILIHDKEKPLGRLVAICKVPNIQIDVTQIPNMGLANVYLVFADLYRQDNIKQKAKSEKNGRIAD